MNNDAKLVVVALIGVAVVGVSLMLMPWAESGFGFDKPALPAWSQPIFDSPPFTGLKPLGDWAQQRLSGKVDKDDESAKGVINPIAAGNYTYAMAMGVAMILAAFAIMFVGKDDAEEKLIIPVKK
ncbi:MAG: hypothetical protein U0103_07820 [Candidatus Obscuribacterales bacterium]|nr:hypothetical protein [Cyanobacteria bacterium SZAS LIN-5]RTL39308.1 MAG: hypothetical protein EKK48_19905 [Candidatus Melainabacteria bacterium]